MELEDDIDEESFDLPESLYSFTMKINGIDTQVYVNLCGLKSEESFLAVNLMRGEEYINSFTMKIRTDPKNNETCWKFVEEYVPKELKKLEEVISDAVIEHK